MSVGVAHQVRSAPHPRSDEHVVLGSQNNLMNLFTDNAVELLIFVVYFCTRQSLLLYKRLDMSSSCAPVENKDDTPLPVDRRLLPPTAAVQPTTTNSEVRPTEKDRSSPRASTLGGVAGDTAP